MTNLRKMEKADEKARVLDQHTRDLLDSAKKMNRRATTAFVICWSVLLIVGIVGIYRQNTIAGQNKAHIDCIVKLLATPIPEGSDRKVIEDLDGQCNVRFTD
ncbi:hypothetical protein UFOVP585_51 [uncultured Caudovirales phage]|uniref:Uncharacterized protein n=1 Tax=uncultured Caudovirales phage TaxID=2100421 RepID=A0A6J5MXT4_9CAUD|nr:hypothetical protein UFOVP585_51 [uncultured Caudovirales phage]